MPPSTRGPSARTANGHQGGVMSYVQPIQSSAEFKATDLDVEENVRTLTNAGAVFRQGDNSNGDATTSSLSALLRRVSGNSTREIDTLIGDLRDLREKLHSDGERIHREIVEYAALSQQVTQLSKIISESVKRLPEAPSADG
ncbi:MAG: hypothetical protein ACLQF4_17315 [Xanthobacteraceae bacterium]